MTKLLTFAEAINDALAVAMSQDDNVIAYGLGADDPKGVFGTMNGLKERFGGDRVFDTPVSENGTTGIAIGAALTGLKPVVCHQRLDFFLLGIEQLVNNAAKWHYMFGGARSVPVTFRLILGMGWGQGPTHSQTLQSWFAHIPGLKVVCPTNAYDAKGLLLESIFDPNPVVFLEHRWLHNSTGDVPAGDYRVPLGKAKILQSGDDVTVVAMSYMVTEAQRTAKLLKDKHDVGIDLIDVRTFAPFDWTTIKESVARTGRLVVVDTSSKTCSFSAEIVAEVCATMFNHLKAAPIRVALPDAPAPTSPALTKAYYNGAPEIAVAVWTTLKRAAPAGLMAELRQMGPHDIPGAWFKGPF